MLPVLKLAAVGMCKNSEARKRMCEYFHLTEEERSRLLPSGKTTFIDNRTNWAITYMRHARLLESPKRGVFSITERGKRVLASDPQEITVNSLCSYPEFAEFLVQCGIDSMSVNPDAVKFTRKLVAQVEQRIILDKLTGRGRSTNEEELAW